MTPANVQTATHLDIGLSREEQARIDALKHVSLDKKHVSSGSIFGAIDKYLKGLTRVKLQDKVTFFQLLATMINAGVPIIRSLYVLADQTNNSKMQEVIRGLAKQMEQGVSLSHSMEKYPTVFSEAERGMISSGEASGNMNAILEDIARQAEKGAMILAKVKGAMVYPIAIIVIMAVALMILLTYVVPQLTELFVGSGLELPRSTQILLSSSDWLIANWQMLIIFSAALSLGVYIMRGHVKFRYTVDYGVLFVPIFGRMMRELMISRFHRMLASLLSAGIPIVRTLEITADATPNRVYKRRIGFAAQDVSQGIPLGENLSSSDFLFPPMVSSMVSIGEQTANLTEVSIKIADYYEGRVDNAVSSLSKLMEPFILVVMGSVVGFVVAAVMQPIMALSDLSSVL
jgi:type IV pilus assembly protein PilC